MRPSLETLAGLYRAAQGNDIALTRVRECIVRHGFTEAEVIACVEVELK